MEDKEVTNYAIALLVKDKDYKVGRIKDLERAIYNREVELRSVKRDLEKVQGELDILNKSINKLRGSQQ